MKMKQILYDVFINLVSTFIAAVITFTVAYLSYIIRRLQFMKDRRKIIYPEKRVLVADSLPIIFRKTDTTTFSNPFTEEEIKFLIKSDKKKNLTNGRCVRLEDFSGGVCTLGIVGFFDFLSTNLVYLPASKSLQSPVTGIKKILFDDGFKREKALENKLKAIIDTDGKLDTFDKVLKINSLANIVTVSALIEDKNGNLLLVKRGDRVVVSSGNFAVSAAGSVAEEDLDKENPFLECARREIKEELGLNVDLTMACMVISKQKMQPAVLFKGKINKPFSELINVMRAAPDFKEENQSLFSVPKEIIPSLVSHFQFTDVAAYQLFLESDKRGINWKFNGIKKIDIEDYRIV